MRCITELRNQHNCRRINYTGHGTCLKEVKNINYYIGSNNMPCFDEELRCEPIWPRATVFSHGLKTIENILSRELRIQSDDLLISKSI